MGGNRASIEGYDPEFATASSVVCCGKLLYCASGDLLGFAKRKKKTPIEKQEEKVAEHNNFDSEKAFKDSMNER